METPSPVEAPRVEGFMVAGTHGAVQHAPGSPLSSPTSACSGRQGSDGGGSSFSLPSISDQFRSEVDSPTHLGAECLTARSLAVDKDAFTKDTDAKSSALKALAGIGKVVSKSRQTDAEALMAIKAQRAKVRAEGGHRHSRTMSSESLPSLPDQSSTPPHVAPPARGHHRRSHSGIQLPTPSAGLVASVPQTSPFAYADWLAGRTLPELLALQKAVQNEIARQLSSISSGPTVGGAVSPTRSVGSNDALWSAQYAATLLTAQQQQHQDHTVALQQALAHAAATINMDSGRGGVSSPLSRGSPSGTPFMSSGRPPRSPQKSFSGATTPPLDPFAQPGSPFSEPGNLAAAAASLSFALDPATPSPGAAPLDMASLSSLGMGSSGSRPSMPSSHSATPEFSFLGDLSPAFGAQVSHQHETFRTAC